MFSLFGDKSQPTAAPDDDKNITKGNTSVDYDPSKMDYAVKSISSLDVLEIKLTENMVVNVRAEAQLKMDKSMVLESIAPLKGERFDQLYHSYHKGIFAVNRVKLASNTTNYASSTVTDASNMNMTSNPPQQTGGDDNDNADNEEEDDKTKSDASADNKRGGTVTIFTVIPGSIKTIELDEGEEWYIHHNAYLASTENVTIQHAISYKLGVDGHGMYCTKVTNNSSKPAFVWVASYGAVIEEDIDDTVPMQFHSGLFLATTKAVYENIRTKFTSNLFSQVSGGETVMMDLSNVKGKDHVIYLQTGNMDELMYMLGKSIPKDGRRLGPNMEYGEEPVESSNVEDTAAELLSSKTENSNAMESKNVPPGPPGTNVPKPPEPTPVINANPPQAINVTQAPPTTPQEVPAQPPQKQSFMANIFGNKAPPAPAKQSGGKRRKRITRRKSLMKRRTTQHLY